MSAIDTEDLSSELLLNEAFDQVLEFFAHDLKKTLIWIYTRNPLLGGFSPYDMILIDRGEKLAKFIKSSFEGNRP